MTEPSLFKLLKGLQVYKLAYKLNVTVIFEFYLKRRGVCVALLMGGLVKAAQVMTVKRFFEHQLDQDS